MSCLPALVIVSVLLPAAEGEAVVRRYVRPQDAGYALEGKLTLSDTDDGPVSSLETTREKVTTTLTLRYDRKDRLQTAAVVFDDGKQKKKAAVQVLGDRQTAIDRDGIKDIRTTEGVPILTAGASWCPVLELARRYDRRKGGKQDFTGIRINYQSDKPLETAVLSMEYLGKYKDKVTFKGRDLALERFKATVNDREYLVFTDAGGRVLKFGLIKADAVPVVLEGYEEALQNLPPWSASP